MPTKMIDTHSHIQFKIFDQNRDQVIEDAKKAGVGKIIAVGTNLETSKKAVEVADKYTQVFASVGIHPHHVFEHFSNRHSGERQRVQNQENKGSWTSQDDELWQQHLKKIEKLISNKKVVAIGETGMDKHDYPNTKYKNYQLHKDFITLQKELFEKQIKLAISFSKSLIIHNRQAVLETLEVLEKNWDKALGGKAVFHMCEPNPDLLNFAIKNKVFISFGGDITYNSEKQEFLKKVPLELLVLETDSPFFTPFGVTSPNTPANLKLIIKTIAEIFKKHEETTKWIILKNSLDLFSLI